MALKRIEEHMLAFKNGFNSETFTATANQTVFNLTNGSYRLNQRRLEIYIQGAKQAAGAFTETSETSFTLSEGVPTGTIVEAKWYESVLPSVGGHNNNHHKGGVDAIDVTQLQNYKEQVSDKFTAVDTQLAEKVHKGDLVTNVKDYGAKGDGTTDDTVAIQNALNSFDQFGGVLYFPKGVYVVSSPLIFPLTSDGISLKSIKILGSNVVAGNGEIGGYLRGATAFNYTGTSGALFELRNGNNTNTIAKVRFENFSAFGSSAVGTLGINAYNVTESHFKNIAFRKFDTGIKIANHSYYSVWDSVFSMYNVGNGIDVFGNVNHTQFFRCRFSSNGKNGARIDYPDTGCVFSGCWIEKNTEDGIYTTNGIQIIVQNCYFELNKKALTLWGSSTTSVFNSLVTGCHFTSSTDYHIGTVRNEGLTIIGSSFYGDVSAYAISQDVRSSTPEIMNVVSVGNIFNNVTAGKEVHPNIKLISINQNGNFSYNQLPLGETTATKTSNNSFFLEGGVLKFKDSTGSVKTVNLT